MPRQPTAWFWAARDAWYTQIDKQHVLLARGKASKAEAQQALYRLLLREGRQPPRSDLTVALAADMFLDHSLAVHAPGTYAVNKARLQVVSDAFGRLKVAELKVPAVERWLAARSCSSSTKRGYIRALKAAIRHCRDEGLLPESVDPLKKLKLPPATRRERTLTPEERRAIWDAASPAVKDMLLAFSESGSRPHVVLELEAKDVDWKAGVATRTSKRKPYRIVLTGRLAARLRELAELRPTGPFLRNTKGGPWNRSSASASLRKICDALGIPRATPYAFRHSYVTDALERGANPAVLAELVNHADLTMISRHYAHIAERREALKRVAEDAAGAGRFDRCDGEAAGNPPPAPPNAPSRPRAGARRS